MKSPTADDKQIPLTSNLSPFYSENSYLFLFKSLIFTHLDSRTKYHNLLIEEEKDTINE